MGSIRQRLAGRVKDQGDRPTCVAFAVSSLHEYWRDMLDGEPSGVVRDLSPEFLYYGCKQLDRLGGDSGTTVAAASAWLKSKGQCLESFHPYRVSSGSLQKPSADAFRDARSKILRTLVRREKKWDRLQRDLLSEGPMVGVIDLFDSAYRVDDRGTLSMPTGLVKHVGLHAVVLLEIEPHAKAPQIVFLNSWGPKWGGGGLGRFGKDYFMNYCRQLWTIGRQKA
jgi:hypothetical protein